MAGEARIPFGPRLRNNILSGNELRDLAPFIHWAPTVCRRADNRHRAAESYHHDRPPDLHDYRLAIEEHIAVRDRVVDDDNAIQQGLAHFRRHTSDSVRATGSPLTHPTSVRINRASRARSIQWMSVSTLSCPVSRHEAPTSAIMPTERRRRAERAEEGLRARESRYTARSIPPAQYR